MKHIIIITYRIKLKCYSLSPMRAQFKKKLIYDKHVTKTKIYLMKMKKTFFPLKES